jgi:hypothetical protein
LGVNFKLGLVGGALLLALAARAQTSTFTYQGVLAANGGLVTGNYDFRFSLLDTNSNVVGGPVTNAPVGVTNGLFTAPVNLGSAVFNGAPLWLEIGVRTNGATGAYTVLAPNQPVTSTPYAIQALNAAAAAQLSAPLPATNITGTLPVTVLSSNVALLSSNLVFSGGDVFAGVVTATNAANVFKGTFSGNGAGLTSLSTLNLTGILPDALLSTNVAMLDATNANFSSNVTAVLYTGSGHGLTNVPGAFFWLTVSGTNAQASSNVGFIATNTTAPVIITLPASPSPGDTFRVAGAGAGGWILAQNAGQCVLAGKLADVTGLSWNQQTNTGVEWTGLASSADGTHLIAVSANGYVYVSANSGGAWTEAGYNSADNWTSVASSTSGTNAVATVETSSGGAVYTSGNGGATWTVIGGTSFTGAQWAACASAASGNNVVAVSSDGHVYTTAGGLSEGPGSSFSGYDWTGAASSADGTKLAICYTIGYIYTSTNSGASWTQQPGAGANYWKAVASSADGTHLVATANQGSNEGIFASVNGGVTWFAVNTTVSVNWAGVASSSDGSRLAACYYSSLNSSGTGYIFTSDDSGSTWLQRDGDAPWTAVACSADGSKLAAAAYNGDLYTSGQGATSTGTGGYLTGGYQSALELQYIGNGLFMPLSHEGTIRAY